MKKKIRNTHDLREDLINTIGDLRDGTIDKGVASVISGLTGRILQSAELDLKYMKFDARRKAFGFKQKLIGSTGTRK